MMKGTLVAAAVLLCGVAAVSAQDAGSAVTEAPPSEPYQKVSDLVPLPDFIPGLGQLFVDPSTLPAGPFLAYDHDGRLVSTVYMIPIEDLNAESSFDDLDTPGDTVDHMDIHYNAGHPGMEMPHAHIILWHVSKEDEARVAE